MSFKKNTPIILFIYIFIIQLLVNIDSYLYSITGHYDSSVFFMCGKALFNGLIPYSDFTDSKGLLLWIIYGIGYKLSNHSYIGVFFITCLNYWITLIIAYKTARLILNENKSLIAAISIAIPYFYWNFYTETKAEHFCTPFVAFSLYLLFNFIYCNKVNNIKWKSFAIGISLIACIMLKWSIGIMLISIIFSVSVYAYKNKQLKNYLIYSLLGSIISLTPFIFYFIINDNLNDFINEYFINTISTVSTSLSETICSYTKEWLNVFTTKRVIYLIYILPLLSLYFREKKIYSLLPFFSGLFFIALSIRHDNFGHYISIVAPFSIFLIIHTIKYFEKFKNGIKYYCIFLLLGLGYIIYGKIYYTDTFFTKSKNDTQFEYINRIIYQVDNPKILNIGQEWGFGISKTLPACKYWISQMGRTEEMHKAQIESLYNRNADFICLYNAETIKVYEKIVLDLGYKKIAEYLSVNIYTNADIDVNFHKKDVKPIDILLKRNTFNIYK